jgi:hypothetical protein
MHNSVSQNTPSNEGWIEVPNADRQADCISYCEQSPPIIDGKYILNPGLFLKVYPNGKWILVDDEGVLDRGHGKFPNALKAAIFREKVRSEK